VGKKAGSQSVIDLAPYGLALPGVLGLIQTSQEPGSQRPIAVLSACPVGPPPHFPDRRSGMAKPSMAHRRACGVIVGVDTHKDVHVARAKDELGRELGELTIRASAAGYRQLLSWSRGLGEVLAFGVEGTGCYGAGLARHLRASGEVVIEVIRPNRRASRRWRKGRSPSEPACGQAVDRRHVFGCLLDREGSESPFSPHSARS
jgi:hypothetical protein